MWTTAVSTANPRPPIDDHQLDEVKNAKPKLSKKKNKASRIRGATTDEIAIRLSALILSFVELPEPKSEVWRGWQTRQ